MDEFSSGRREFLSRILGVGIVASTALKGCDRDKNYTPPQSLKRYIFARTRAVYSKLQRDYEQALKENKPFLVVIGDNHNDFASQIVNAIIVNSVEMLCQKKNKQFLGIGYEFVEEGNVIQTNMRQYIKNAVAVFMDENRKKNSQIMELFPVDPLSVFGHVLETDKGRRNIFDSETYANIDKKIYSDDSMFNPEKTEAFFESIKQRSFNQCNNITKKLNNAVAGDVLISKCGMLHLKDYRDYFADPAKSKKYYISAFSTSPKNEFLDAIAESADPNFVRLVERLRYQSSLNIMECNEAFSMGVLYPAMTEALEVDVRKEAVLGRKNVLWSMHAVDMVSQLISEALTQINDQSIVKQR